MGLSPVDSSENLSPVEGAEGDDTNDVPNDTTATSLNNDNDNDNDALDNNDNI